MRRGAILLEVLLSIGLFAGAASFTIAALRAAVTALERERAEQLALDLARSTLGELEAGLVSFQDIRDGERRGVGSLTEYRPAGDLGDDPAAQRWTFEVSSQRTEYAGLSLVELTVREQRDEPDEGIRVTLRQLMRLRAEDADPYEQDELLEGLPETAP